MISRATILVLFLLGATSAQPAETVTLAQPVGTATLARSTKTATSAQPAETSTPAQPADTARAAQPAEAAMPAPPAETGPTVRVRLLTSDGAIVVELDKQAAPLTTANFLRYVDQKRFDGTSFYRATKVEGAPGLGLIQGGVRGDPKRVLPPIAHEPTTRTGLAHVDGTISMARTAPGTARGDFFITLGAMSSLDASPQAVGDNQGFAAFGHVVEGMDVVHRILDEPTSPTAGEGVIRGQILARPVRIVTARRDG